MRVPDVCERWKWRSAEEIIERLMAESSSSRRLPIIVHVQPPRRDRYSRMARRYEALKASKSDALLNAVRNSI
jgi:hypothetical protein